MKEKNIFIWLVLCILFINVNNSYATELISSTEISGKEERITELTYDEYEEIIEYSKPSYSVTNSIKSDLKQRVYEGLLNLEERIYIGDMMFDNVQQPLLIYFETINEHPDIFYTTNHVSRSSNYINVEYQYATNDIQVLKQELNDKVQGIITDIIDDTMTELEKEIAIHDYLLVNAVYDTGTYEFENHRVHGVLLYGKGVCESYAYAFSLLLDKVGIESHVVSSTEINHAWNIVKLDGKYYQVDVTWDDPVPDQGNTIFYDYFNLTDEEMESDHTGLTTDMVCDDNRFAYLRKMKYAIYNKDGKNFYFNNKDDNDWKYAWIPVFAPIAGAGMAALVYLFICTNCA